MLPSEDMARVLATRRLIETERAARDRGVLRDMVPPTQEAPDRATMRPGPDRRPCQAPCPERAQRALG